LSTVTTYSAPIYVVADQSFKIRKVNDFEIELLTWEIEIPLIN